MFKQLADNRRDTSLATKYRRQRIALFRTLIATLPPPIRVLDVGGTQQFWEMVEFKESDIEITLLNLEKAATTSANFCSVVGDARNMRNFANQEFDVAFSNSVIEHVGRLDQQMQMATEIRRVARRYFVQTPNRYFPIEPHFVFPAFQFLPLRIQVWLVCHFALGWHRKYTSKSEAAAAVTEIRLLSQKELQQLFPGANLFKEKFLGLVKSFVVYGGWDNL